MKRSTRCRSMFRMLFKIFSLSYRHFFSLLRIYKTQLVLLAEPLSHLRICHYCSCTFTQCLSFFCRHCQCTGLCFCFNKCTSFLRAYATSRSTFTTFCSVYKICTKTFKMLDPFLFSFLVDFGIVCASVQNQWSGLN